MKKKGLYIFLAVLFLVGGVGVQRLISFTRTRLAKPSAYYVETVCENLAEADATQVDCLIDNALLNEDSPFIKVGSPIFKKPFMPKLPFPRPDNNIGNVH